ncbi:MAG: hypothetical protein SO179_00165 [Bacteroidales bacterium]|nr:hypothetical protein [Bacteroidales bacterium]
MKRKLLYFLATIMMFTAIGNYTDDGGLMAQSKQLQKARAKMVKKQIKKYKKEGWIVDGTTKSLEVALMEHYEKLNTDENNREIVGSVSGCNSRNLCQNQAMNNAMIKYAQEAKSHVMGRINSEVGNVSGNELDGFYSAYERLVSASIEGELNSSISLYRVNKDGLKEYDSFFIINENKASKKRIKAMQDAAKESEAAQKYAKQISDFVREGFDL